MSETVENNSLVKVHYVGTLPKTNQIFDTSREEVAKENKIFNKEREYGPLEVEMGQQKVIAGFENALLGMSEGEKKTIEIPPENAYGEIQDDYIVDVSNEEFADNNIDPQKGMMIQTSNGVATIAEYDEGEGIVTLDFNHPLAGKTLKFDLEVVTID